MLNRRLLLSLSVAGIAGAGRSSQAQDIAAALAPTGVLRVGVYEGSPLSLLTDGKTGAVSGLSTDFGAMLGQRLGVPVRRVVFRRVAEVLQAMKAGAVDFTVSNATPVRAQDVAFSQTLVSLELGFLVPAGSAIVGADAVDRPGVRVGVVEGSTSQRTLPRLLPKTTVVAAPDVKIAVQMFEQGALDVFATNKPTLFEMADAMPGARVLDGRWGAEHIAFVIPQGRDAGMAYIRAMVTQVQSDGSLDRAIARAGLRGSMKAE
jgi:polar amino acid transport system substrate-binding protein